MHWLNYYLLYGQISLYIYSATLVPIPLILLNYHVQDVHDLSYTLVLATKLPQSFNEPCSPLNSIEHQLSATSSLRLPTAFPTGILKRPSNKPNTKLRTRFNLFGLGLEFIYIPVCPQKPALQETRFEAREPNIEARWQRN